MTNIQGASFLQNSLADIIRNFIVIITYLCK